MSKQCLLSVVTIKISRKGKIDGERRGETGETERDGERRGETGRDRHEEGDGMWEKARRWRCPQSQGQIISFRIRTQESNDREIF